MLLLTKAGISRVRRIIDTSLAGTYGMGKLAFFLMLLFAFQSWLIIQFSLVPPVLSLTPTLHIVLFCFEAFQRIRLPWQSRNSEAFKLVVLNGLRNKRVDFSGQVTPSKIKVKSEQNEGRVMCKPDQFQLRGSGETEGRGQCAALSCFSTQGSSPLLLAASPQGSGQSSLTVSVSLLGFSL